MSALLTSDTMNDDNGSKLLGAAGALTLNSGAAVLSMEVASAATMCRSRDGARRLISIGRLHRFDPTQADHLGRRLCLVC